MRKKALSPAGRRAYAMKAVEGGLWGGFGMTVGSVIAFQNVLMAWYGVNFVLGAGLHSYGFGTGGFPLVATSVGGEILFLLTAILRRNRKRFLEKSTAMISPGS